MTFACMECGKKFKTLKAAERAADRGCPKCGGVDIDEASTPRGGENLVDGCVKCLFQGFRCSTHEDQS